jgi:hypothetical protein
MRHLVAVLIVLTFGLALWGLCGSSTVDAQVAASQPTAQAPPDIDSIVQAFKAGKYGLAIGFLLLLLTELVKRGVRLFKKDLPPAWLPWIAAGMGVSGTVGISLSVGAHWSEAVMAGVAVGATAGGLWSMLARHFRKKSKEVTK